MLRSSRAKRILIWILAAAMILGMFPTAAFAEETNEVSSSLSAVNDSEFAPDAEELVLDTVTEATQGNFYEFTAPEDGKYYYFMTGEDGVYFDESEYNSDGEIIGGGGGTASESAWYLSQGEKVYVYISYVDQNSLVRIEVTKADLALTLDANGGYFYFDDSEIMDYYVLSGKEIGSLPEPNNPDEKMMFVGWTPDPEAEEIEFVYDEMVFYSPVTLYAVWGEKVSIDFIVNSDNGYFWGWDDEIGEEIEKDMVSWNYAAGSRFRYLPYPEYYESYPCFIGWALSPDAEEPDITEDSIVPGEDTTYYGVWKEFGEDTVKLVLDQEITVSEYGKYSFTAPTDGRYVFFLQGTQGFWNEVCISSEDESEWYNSESIRISREINAGQTILLDVYPGDEMTLLIKKADLALTLDANGGYFDEDEETLQFYVLAGMEAGALPTPDSANTAMAFAGWTMDPEADEIEYVYDWTVFEEETTLYAVWETLAEIIFDANGGCFYEDPEYTQYREGYRPGETFWAYGIFESEVYHPDGLGLAGWAESRNAKPDEVLEYYQVPENGATLYAVWTTKVTLTFDVNNKDAFFIRWDDEIGEDVFEDTWSEQYISGKTFYPYYLPAPVIKPEGSIFMGWAKTKDAVSPDIDENDTVPEVDTTYYGVWKDFASNAEVLVPDQEVSTTGAEKYYKFTAPEEGRYGFGIDSGEAVYSTTRLLNPAGETLYLTEGGRYTIYRDMDKGETVYLELHPSSADAMMKAIVKKADIVLTLDANGGRLDNGEIIHEKLVASGLESGFLLGAYSVDPLIGFAGWATNPNAEEAEYDIGGGVFTANTTLYAVWKPFTRVRLDANGGHFWEGPEMTVTDAYRFAGEILELAGYNDGSAIINPNGLRLAGWAESPDASIADVVDTYTVTEEDVTLYAIWNTPVTVTFMANHPDAFFNDWDPEQQTTIKTDRLRREFAVGARLGYYITLEPGRDNDDLVFLGWATSPDAKEPNVTRTSIVTDPGPTYYAVWQDSLPAAPTISELGNTGSGITVNFTAVEGAEKYQLDVKKGKETGFTVLSSGITTAPYLDKTATLMKEEYTYRVRAYVNGRWTEYSEPESIIRNPFEDVQASTSGYTYISWAYNNGIVKGTSETSFSPTEPCSRVAFVMMLYKMAGSPNVSGDLPFTDVTGSKTRKAVLWAYQNGYVSGTSGTTFSPDDSITRMQIVMILYKMAGSPQITGTNPFTDVTGNKKIKAVLWAKANNITKGTSSTTFSPDNECTRAQLVTFLYKYDLYVGKY